MLPIIYGVVALATLVLGGCAASRKRTCAEKRGDNEYISPKDAQAICEGFLSKLKEGGIELPKGELEDLASNCISSCMYNDEFCCCIEGEMSMGGMVECADAYGIGR